MCRIKGRGGRGTEGLAQVVQGEFGEWIESDLFWLLDGAFGFFLMDWYVEKSARACLPLAGAIPRQARAGRRWRGQIGKG